MRRAALALALLALASGGPALAQSPLERGFRTADRNGDGVITIGEMEAQQDQRFRAGDRNGDAGLTLEEFTGAAPDGLTAEGRRQWGESRRLHFRHLDRDRDGRLTRREFAETARRAFSAADADRDSALSPQEIAAFVEQGGARMAQNAARLRRDSLDRDGDGRLGAEEFATARAAAMAARDADGDGALVFEEYAPSGTPEAQAPWRASFTAADANGDGRIDALENHGASNATFRRLDRDGDGDLSLRELYAR